MSARRSRGGSRPPSARRGGRPAGVAGRGARNGAQEPAPPAPGPRGQDRVGRDDPSRPAQLTGAAVLVAVEGVVAVAYALSLGVLAVVDDPTESVVGVVLGALLVLALGVGLLAAARALSRRRGGPRGAVTTVQILTVLTAVSTVPRADPGWVAGGLVAVALAVGVLVLLFSAPARRALDEGPDRR